MVIQTFIKHRINTIDELKNTPKELGVEFDLRPWEEKIILHHDPFKTGDDFEEYLLAYQHSTAIVNTKAEGMEARIIKMLQEREIVDFFFLDLSIPFLIKTIKAGCSKVAVRFSEFEPLSFVEKFEGKAEWVWVDCFTKNILDKSAYEYLKKHFKICIVSPELQGHPKDWIDNFKSDFTSFELDAICTKTPELWK